MSQLAIGGSCAVHEDGAVAQWVERWTCDQQVEDSNPTRGKAA